MLLKFQYKTGLFLVLVLLISSAKAQNTVSDRTYTIKVTEKGMGTKDGELYLKNNEISATFSLPNGFPPAIYTSGNDTTTLRNVQTFTADCSNGKKHVLHWSGKIDGLNIQGKAQHFYFGKLAGEYVFTGTLKR